MDLTWPGDDGDEQLLLAYFKTEDYNQEAQQHLLVTFSKKKWVSFYCFLLFSINREVSVDV